MRNLEEIQEQINKANKIIEDENSLGIYGYEEGVKYALEWVMKNIDEKPIED